MNVGVDWSEYYVIIEFMISVLLFYGYVDLICIFGSVVFLFENLWKEVVMYLFLKLDVLEICKENLDVFLVRFGSLCMVFDLLGNEGVKVFEGGNFVMMLFRGLFVVLSLLDWVLSLDEVSLYMEVDSFWGLLLLVVL